MYINKIILLSILLTVMALPQEKYGSEIMLNAVVPTGPDAKFFNTGLGINGNFYYDIEKNIRIGISIGYLRITADGEEISNHYKSISSEGDLQASGSISALPLMLTFRLISPESSMRIYGLIEGGLWTYWIKASGEFTNNGATSKIDKSEFRNEAGFAVGLGTLFGLSDVLSLDISVKYQFVQDSEYLNVNYNSISTSQMLLFGAGLNWNFDI